MQDVDLSMVTLQQLLPDGYESYYSTEFELHY